MGDAAKKRFEQPDETRTLDKGELHAIKLVASTAGRAIFQPGWRWSESVKPVVGGDNCEMHHVGYAMSGNLHVVTAEGQELDISAGDAYEILPGHDAWVVGDEAFQGLEFQSATVETYGKMAPS